MNKRLLTLFSDYDVSDPFLAQVRGGFASLGADMECVIDLMHGLSDCDLPQAAFRWRRAWPHFPQGSFHLALQEYGEVAAIWLLRCRRHTLCSFSQSLCIWALPPGCEYELRQYQIAVAKHPNFAGREILVPFVANFRSGDEQVEFLIPC